MFQKTIAAGGNGNRDESTVESARGITMSLDVLSERRRTIERVYLKRLYLKFKIYS